MRRIVLVLIMLLLATAASAEYTIGPGDVLQITVWQFKDLDRTVTVRQDGIVTFPPIGDVQAAGLSTEGLASRVEDQLFSYTRGTTKVTVAIQEFRSRYVVVNGAVARPGRYAFEEIPGLFEVISVAGGVLPGARLSEVWVLRTTPQRTTSFRADLNAYLQSGDREQLPALEVGDAIFVPGGAAGAEMLPGVATPGPTTIAILGAVGRPGTYEVQHSFSLPEVIGLAGGLTPEADLEEIKVLSREPDGSELVATLDLEEIFRAGEPMHYPVRPGDAIYVPTRRPGFWGTIGRGALATLALSRDLVNFVLVIDTLQN